MKGKGLALVVRLVLSGALLGTVAFGVVGRASAATIIYVKYNATGANNGTSWANAYKNLQKALAHAPVGSGDQIWVAKGTYAPTAGTDRTISFVLKNGVAIYGGFAGSETLLSQRKPSLNVTTLSGQIGSPLRSLHVVRSSGNNGTAVLDGFTIIRGLANGTTTDWGGGGIYNYASSPTLNNLVIESNAAGNGGGMLNYNNSHPKLTHIMFAANTSTYGGGGMYNDVSSPTLLNVTFQSNSDSNDEGGGMDNYQSNPVLTNVAFLANSAPTGGGLDNYQSNPTLTNVTFTSNSASFAGGGIFNSFSSPVLTKVSFKANSAAYDGGGIYSFQGSSPKLNTVAFIANSAGRDGGGMYNAAGSAALTNVTFTANSAAQGGGAIYNMNSAVSLLKGTFTSNSAASDGGGILNVGSSPVLMNVTFSKNSSGYGGGIENLNGSNPQIVGATLNANAASVSGGGIYNDGNSNPLVANVTFYANTASAGTGGGIYNYSSSPTLKNVTFSGNSAFYASAMANSTGANPHVSDSIFWNDGTTEIINDFSAPVFADSILAGGCPSGSGGCTNLSTSDPKLGPLQANGGYTMTMALGAGSAAIDTGNNMTCTATDQRGVSRPQGEACDMGAYEVSVLYFRSTGAYDGQVLESAKGSNLGGSLNSTNAVFHVGDNQLNRRYRGFLSFNTAALPDTATVVFARFTVKQSAAPTGNPFGTQGALLADLANPYFGTSVSLQLSDWQAGSTLTSVGTLLPDGSLYWAALNAAALAHINKAGPTQIRLRFATDIYNSSADYLSLYSGDATTASYRPLLGVYYNP